MIKILLPLNWMPSLFSKMLYRNEEQCEISLFFSPNRVISIGKNMISNTLSYEINRFTKFPSSYCKEIFLRERREGGAGHRVSRTSHKIIEMMGTNIL